METQVELCKTYLFNQFPQLSEADIVVYEDEGFSGGNVRRPRFQQMLVDAKSGQLDTIICYRLDRISRNISDFSLLIKDLNDHQISFISIREQFDTSSPMGRAMMYIASIFSQLERETIAERIKDNMNELAKTGRWLGGIAPTGYTAKTCETIRLDGKVKKTCHLQAIPAELQTIRTIYTSFLDIGSLSGTERMLCELGILTKNHKLFSRFSIKNILVNPVYMIADKTALRYWLKSDAQVFSDDSCFDGHHGMIAYNRTLQTSGKTNVYRPISEWIIAVGKHEGCIPGTQWIRVQQLLREISRPRL